MLSFTLITGLYIGIELCLFIIFCVVLANISTEKLARLCSALFGFKRVPSDNEKATTIDICGDTYDLSPKLSTRLPVVLVLAMCFMVILAIFMDGCVFSGKYLLPGQLCISSFPYCYVFKSRFTLYSPSDQFICRPDEPVIHVNASAGRAICFGVFLLDQSTVDILNQLGICSGILAIIKVLYPSLYKFGRRHIGAICLICLFCCIAVGQTMFIVMQYSVSFVTLILLNLIGFLLLTIIYIHWKRRKTRAPHLAKLLMDLNKF